MGPLGRSGQVRKISPPTGIRSPDRPPTPLSIASRYTDHANRPTILAYPLFQIITTEEGGATHCLFFLSPWYRLYPGTVNRLTMNRLLRYAG